MKRLSELESKVLEAWRDTDPGMGYHFRDTSERCGVELPKIRRAVRSLARKGMVSFYRAGWTEYGDMYGSGYALTDAGSAALSASQKD